MNAREGALKVLHKVDIQGAYSNIALNKELKTKGYTPLDKGFITELVYGVLENLIFIDYIIGQFATLPLHKMNDWTRNILRLGIYQIYFLDKVPSFAAVNETVDLSKIYCKKTTGFINGILRNVLRNKDQIKMPDQKKSPVQYLSVRYSHPVWMIDLFLQHFSEEFVEKLLASNNETPDLFVRVNTLKVSPEACIKLLQEQGYEVIQSTQVEEALVVKGISGIETLDAYKKGWIQVQDFSSMLVGKIMDPQENDFVIDVCSAPGGKTTHMAQLMNNKGKILARDIHEHKVELIKKSAKRLGIDIIEAEQFNGKELDKSLIAKADKVLVDAPCSGLGIIRRKPEIKYRKNPDDVEEITAIQLEILQNASQYVKPGGFILYSTCTIDPRENEEIVNQFLAQNSQFELVNIGEKYKQYIPGSHEKGMVQLYPHLHHTDGFFIAKLHKSK